MHEQSAISSKIVQRSLTTELECQLTPLNHTIYLYWSFCSIEDTFLHNVLLSTNSKEQKGCHNQRGGNCIDGAPPLFLLQGFHDPYQRVRSSSNIVTLITYFPFFNFDINATRKNAVLDLQAF